MNNFYGDQMRWWIGIVEEVGNDIPRLGRAKVRIYGIHADATEISTADLPYAQVLIPTTEGGVSGIGQNSNLVVGAQVFGIFLDGVSSQLPLVMGSIPKIDVPSNEQVDNIIQNPSTGSIAPYTNQGILAAYDKARSTSGSNLELAWNFFSILLYSPVSIAAMLGNFFVESAILSPDGNDIATGKQIGGPAYGIAQWEGSRLDSLKESAAKSGLEFTDIMAQLTFVIEELTGQIGTESAANRVRDINDVTTATVFFQHVYERNAFLTPKKRSQYTVEGKPVNERGKEKERIDAALSIYAKFTVSA